MTDQGPDSNPDTTRASEPAMARPAGEPAQQSPGSSPEADGPRPVFELAEDRCIKCGEKMPHYATICLKCGYDMHSNQVRTTEVGESVAPVPSEPAPVSADFVQPGRLRTKALVVIGGVLSLGAAVGAATLVGQGMSFWPRAGLVLLALYQIVINTGTGVGALAVAAWLHKQPLGKLELAAGRMFVAFAAFQCASQMQFRLGWSWVGPALALVVGLAVYFGVLLILFRKDRRTTALVAVTHLLIWIALYLGTVFYNMVGPIAAATNAAAPK